VKNQLRPDSFRQSLPKIAPQTLQSVTKLLHRHGLSVTAHFLRQITVAAIEIAPLRGIEIGSGGFEAETQVIHLRFELIGLFSKVRYQFPGKCVRQSVTLDQCPKSQVGLHDRHAVGQPDFEDRKLRTVTRVCIQGRMLMIGCSAHESSLFLFICFGS
jgi:hypothetical protein